MQNETQVKSQADLTEREQEILRLIASGTSNKDIARQLFISTNTVKVHLRNIFAKIGVNSRTEAAVYAIQAGAAQTSDLSARELESPENHIGQVSISKKGLVIWVSIVIFVLISGVIAIFYYRYRNTKTSITSQTVAPQRWQELASLPTARSGLAVAVYENQIYAIGGETAQGVTGIMERYDVTTDKWTKLTSKPVPVSDINAAVIGGQIYVPGGRLASGGVTDVLESYDPSRNQWENRNPLPVALSGYALAAFEGKLYVFGGWDGQKYLASVYEYDPDQNKWIIRIPMPTARGFAGAATAGGSIYVIGGYDGKKPLAVNQEYLPERNTWSKDVPLPAGCYAMGVASIADLIFVVGGIGETGSSQPPLQYIYQQEQWQKFASPLFENWSRLGAIQTGTHLYFLGGLLNGISTAQNFSYQAIYTIMLPVIP